MSILRWLPPILLSSLIAEAQSLITAPFPDNIRYRLIATDAAGTLYTADDVGQVRRVTLSASVVVAGGGSSLLDNIPATSARLNPTAIGIDPSGDLIIAE